MASDQVAFPRLLNAAAHHRQVTFRSSFLTLPFEMRMVSFLSGIFALAAVNLDAAVSDRRTVGRGGRKRAYGNRVNVGAIVCRWPEPAGGSTLQPEHLPEVCNRARICP